MSSAFEQVKVPVDTSGFETRAMFAKSKDGTRVPFFVTARKDLKRDGSNPTVLYGYGGFLGHDLAHVSTGCSLRGSSVAACG
jgi:prolyl oligopeptidase